MVRKIKETKSKAVVATKDSRNSKTKRAYKAKTSKKPKTVPPQETDQADFSTAISIQEKVALLAYNYWEKRGSQGGSPEEDWYRAEKEVLGQLSISEQ